MHLQCKHHLLKEIAEDILSLQYFSSTPQLASALPCHTPVQKLQNTENELTVDDIPDIFPCSLKYNLSDNNPLAFLLAAVQSFTTPASSTPLSQLFNFPNLLPKIRIFSSLHGKTVTIEPPSQHMPLCNYFSVPK